MELTGSETDRYKKIVADFRAMDSVLVGLFMRFCGKAPKKIVLDIDVTDDPVHGIIHYMVCPKVGSTALRKLHAFSKSHV